jgi:hypothetical protein
MNRTLKLAFGALLGTMLIMPSLAQDGNFPDVPENHWVFQALLNMKNEGILVGYPDELFRGARPATRYELAGAINAAYQKLKGMIGGLQNQIDAIKGMGGAEGVSKADFDAMKAELDKLKQDLASMSRWGDDIANLKKMVATFEKDLAGLGVDVEAMKKDLSDLAARVSELEKHKPAVDIHGDVNFVMHMGHSTDDFFGLTVDARPTGVRRNGFFGSPGGMTEDMTMGHELGLAISGTNETGPKWHATLVVGNLVGFGQDPSGLDGSSSDFYATYGDQSSLARDLPFREVNTSVYFQDFMVDFGTEVFGQMMNVTVGRMGKQSGNWFFKRWDNTPYFENSRWDDGNWYMTGANLAFNWNTVGLNIWGGRNSDQLNSDGPIPTFGIQMLAQELWPMWAGAHGFQDVWGMGDVRIDRSLGTDLNFKLGQNGDVMLHYIMLDTDSPGSDPVSSSPYNRVTVWGGEANFNLGNFLAVNGGYSRSDLSWNTSNVLTEDNFAWWAKGHFNLGKAGINLGYRHVEPYFGAPGDWGRAGFLWNPVDHQGFFGDIALEAGQVGINVAGFYYEALDGAIWPSDMKMVGVNANLNFKLGAAWKAMLGWEHVVYQDYNVDSGDPVIDWYRLGLSRNMADGSTLRFMYEMSRYDDKGSGFLGSVLGSSWGNDLRRGGMLTTQWSKRF